MKFTKTAIKGIEATGKRYTIFDDEFIGLAVRVGAKGGKVFYFVYRAGKGRAAPLRWLKLGKFPNITVEQARHMAKDKAAVVTLGGDPALEIRQSKSTPLTETVLETFMAEFVDPRLKASSAANYRSLIDLYLKPTLGKLRIKEVDFRHIAKLHHSLRDKPYQANRTIAVAGSFFSWATEMGYIDHDKVNPVAGINKYKEHKRQEFMTPEILSLIGETIARMEKTWHERQVTKERRTGELVDTITPSAAAGIRLLMFTGARLGEILGLEWDKIDLEKGVATLSDSKTGFKVLQLPAPAVAVLRQLPRMDKYVFPSYSSSGHMGDLRVAWVNVLRQAGLKSWRLHDLRHAFASVMVNSGASLPVVGKILGHSNPSTTARYAHLEASPARQAAEEAAAIISQAINNKPEKVKVQAAN
ncbi:MAG: tyrosine-type recombinase/integrase [Desulfarculales bacterium]|jgi:integrase|nr:tyrosine-type recombinase/integrase [Desulfarculales bacterium]